MGITIISAVLIFGLLIFVHELGHFTVAKAVGIRVHQFALGMGPVVLKKQKGDTTYMLKAFPVGGYVMMEGEDEESNGTDSFQTKPGWAKALVLFAGSAMNYITAVILVFALILNAGFATSTLGEVMPGQPAAVAGLKAGDEIVAIDGKSVNSWQNIVDEITNGTGNTVEFTVLRQLDGAAATEVTITSTVGKNPEDGHRVVGIKPHFEKDFFKSFQYAFVGTYEMMAQMLDYIGKLFIGQGSINDLSGPVGIVKVVGDSAELGFKYLVNLTALISLNLAIVNLLPLPALDGGRLIFLAIESITRKKISPAIEGKIHFVGFALLMLLMVVITVKDVNTIFFK